MSRQQLIRDLASLRQGCGESMLDYFARAQELLERVALIQMMTWICKLADDNAVRVMDFQREVTSVVAAVESHDAP